MAQATIGPAARPALPATVGDVLLRYGVHLEESSSIGIWQASLGRKHGEVSLIEGWLCLDFPAPRGRPRRTLRLLERNAGHRGNAKYVLTPDGSVRLRAEVPMDTRLDAPKGLDVAREGIAGLAGALGVTPARERAATDSSVTSGSDMPDDREASQPPLADLCEEAGWPFSQRSEDRVEVDLEISGGAFFQASVSRDDGRVRCQIAPLRDPLPEDARARRAAAALALSVAGSVRMTSAIAWSKAIRTDRDQPAGAGLQLGFRVDLPANASAVDLGHALSALSVACDLCGNEIRALCSDPELAGLYLELRHPCWAGPGRRGNGRSKAPPDPLNEK